MFKAGDYASLTQCNIFLNQLLSGFNQEDHIGDKTNTMKCWIPQPYIKADMQINGLKTWASAEWQGNHERPWHCPGSGMSGKGHILHLGLGMANGPVNMENSFFHFVRWNIKSHISDECIPKCVLLTFCGKFGLIVINAIIWLMLAV